MLTATLPCSLTILSSQVSQNDTGIDQAVYVPSIGAIVGVRGGYLLQFDLNGVYQKSARFCSPNFGDGAICYDTINDKLICSFWNEQNTRSLLGDTRGLYKINPHTFAVELFASSASRGTAIPEAIHNLNFFDAQPTVNGTLWGTGPILCQIDPVTFLTTPVQPFAAGLYWPIWADLGRDIGNDGVFTVDPINQVAVLVPGNYSISLTSLPNPFPYVAPTNIDGYGICAPATPPGSSFLPAHALFISTRDGKVWWFVYQQGQTQQGTWQLIPLSAPPSLVYHLRCNPYNGKIYAPDVAGNRVFVITPNVSVIPSPGNPGYFEIAAAPALAHTYTGFDSPIDVVFVPSGTFAVQQGLTGLRRFE